MTFRILMAFVCAGILGGCGGGGDGGTDPRPPSSGTNNLTGAAPPIETPAMQRARSPGITSRTDSLIISTSYGETSDPGLPAFRIRASCSGTRCSVSEQTSGYSQTVTPSDFEFSAGPVEAVGSKHGITLMWQHEGREFTAFGAWMNHSGFAVQSGSDTVEGIRVDARFGIAAGDLTGMAPTGSATWNGLMVGRIATGSSRGDRLQGDAALNIDVESVDRLPGGYLSLDAAFTSIKNIDRGAAHSTQTVLFTDIPVSSRGTYRAGLTGNRIQGGFYGPGHAEAAGIFEQSNIVGAFGARRQ